MNVLIGKTATIRFTEIEGNDRTWGGTDFIATMLFNLAKAYPQHNFYYWGPGKWEGCPSIPNNLINLYGIVKDNVPHTHNRLEPNPYYKWAIDYIKKEGYQFDVCIVFYCVEIDVTKHDMGYMSSKGTERIVRVDMKRVAGIFTIADAFDVPTYYIINDVRQLNKLPCDVKAPAGIFSQLNGVDRSKYYINLSDKAIRETPIKYKPIELFWMQTKKKVDFRNMPKTNGMIMVVNGAFGRYKYLKKWLFPYMPDCKVYGDWVRNKSIWDDIVADGRENNFEIRGMIDMEEEMFNSRYTLVIPSTTTRSINFPEFVTQKVYSMIYYGIIPFWCVDDYDASGIYKEIPDYVKVKTPEELYAKIDELNNDEEKYRALLNQLYDLLHDRYFSEEFMHDVYDEILL